MILLPLPKTPEIRVTHAPLLKAQGSLLLMIAAAYGRNQATEGVDS